MIRVTIKNLDGKETNGGDFKSQAEVDEWLLKNQEDKAFGDPSEYTIEQVDNTVVKEQKSKIEVSLGYLAKTDWYFIRQLERSIEVPDVIKAKRDEAYATLKEIPKEDLEKIKAEIGL